MEEVLKQFLGEDRAKPLAASWDGDRYVVYEQKRTKRLVLVSRVRLLNEAQAARFFGQYSEALEKKYQQRTNLFRRPNFFSFDSADGSVSLRCLDTECITVEGTTRAIFDGVNKAITWPGAPVAPLEHPQPPERTTPVCPGKNYGCELAANSSSPPPVFANRASSRLIRFAKASSRRATCTGLTKFSRSAFMCDSARARRANSNAFL